MNLDVCGSKECAICLDTYTREDPRIVLICKNTTDDVGDGNGNRHCFHKSCITDWLSKGGRVCPSCRDEISPETILNNFEPERELIINKNINYYQLYVNCIQKFSSLSDSFMQFQLTKSISLKEPLKEQSFSKKIATYVSNIIKSKKYDEAKQKYDEAKQKYDEAKQKYDEAVKQIDTIDIPKWLLPLHNFYKLYMDLHYNLSIVFFYYLVDIIDYDIYIFLHVHKIFDINKEKYERLKEKYEKLKKKNLEKVLEIVPKLFDATNLLLIFLESFDLINNPIHDLNMNQLIRSARDFTDHIESIRLYRDYHPYIYQHETLEYFKKYVIFDSRNRKLYSDDIFAKIIVFVQQTEMNNTKTEEYLQNVKEIMRFISNIYERQYDESSAAETTTGKKIDIDRALIVKRASSAAMKAEEKIVNEAYEDAEDIVQAEQAPVAEASAAEASAAEASAVEALAAEQALVAEEIEEAEEPDETDEDEDKGDASNSEFVAGGMQNNRQTTKKRHTKKTTHKKRHTKKRHTKKRHTKKRPTKKRHPKRRTIKTRPTKRRMRLRDRQ